MIIIISLSKTLSSFFLFALLIKNVLSEFNASFYISNIFQFVLSTKVSDAIYKSEIKISVIFHF